MKYIDVIQLVQDNRLLPYPFDWDTLVGNIKDADPSYTDDEIELSIALIVAMSDITVSDEDSIRAETRLEKGV